MTATPPPPGPTRRAPNARAVSRGVRGMVDDAGLALGEAGVAAARRIGRQWHQEMARNLNQAAVGSVRTRAAATTPQTTKRSIYGVVNSEELGKWNRRFADARRLDEYANNRMHLAMGHTWNDRVGRWVPPPAGYTLRRNPRHVPGGWGEAPGAYLAGARDYILRHAIADPMDRVGASIFSRFRHAVLLHDLAPGGNALVLDRKLRTYGLPRMPTDPSNMNTEQRERYLGEFFVAVTGGARPSRKQAAKDAASLIPHETLAAIDQDAEEEVLTFLRLGHFSSDFDPNDKQVVTRVVDRLEVLRGPSAKKLEEIKLLTKRHLKAQGQHAPPRSDILMVNKAAKHLLQSVSKIDKVLLKLEAGAYEPHQEAEDDFFAASFELSPLDPNSYNGALRERFDRLAVTELREPNPEMAERFFQQAWFAYEARLKLEIEYENRNKDAEYRAKALKFDTMNDQCSRIAASYVDPADRTWSQPGNIESARQDVIDVMSRVRHSPWTLEQFEDRLRMPVPDLGPNAESSGYQNIRFLHVDNVYDAPQSINQLLGTIETRVPTPVGHMPQGNYGYGYRDRDLAGLNAGYVPELQPGMVRMPDPLVKEALDDLGKVLGEALRVSAERGEGWVGGTGNLRDLHVIIDGIGADTRMQAKIRNAYLAVVNQGGRIPADMPLEQRNAAGAMEPVRRPDGSTVMARDAYNEQVEAVGRCIERLVREPTPQLARQVGDGLAPPVRPTGLELLGGRGVPADYGLAG
jgi:hypothetical protein